MGDLWEYKKNKIIFIMAMFNPVTQKNSAIPSAQVVDDSGEKKKKNFLQQEEMSGWNRLKEGSHLPWAVGVKQKLQKGTEKKMTGWKITNYGTEDTTLLNCNSVIQVNIGM